MATLVLENHSHSFDMSRAIDISIPLQFNGPQPNAYGVDPATSVPCSAGELVGDTRKGGSCNFEQYTFIAHCNGTHTECVGHITHERISVRDCLRDALLVAAVISVQPVPASRTSERYAVETGKDDTLITRDQVKNKLEAMSDPPRALVVRTLPNSDAKLTRRYIDDVPPYFTTEAMEYIVETGVEHLVVDLPSIDRLYDAGKLANHRIFWKVDLGSFELSEIARQHCTITELAYIPNDVEDGLYLLNLQIAPFASDASPSRPLLFALAQN